MKKILSLALVLMVAVAAKAQLYVGGSLGLWGNNDPKTTLISILPEVGYSFNDSWSAGVALGYTYSKANTTDNAFTIAPYARWSFYKSGIVRLFVDGGFSYEHLDYMNDPYKHWDVGFKPGLALDITEHFSVIAHLGLIGYEDADDEIIAAGLAESGYGLRLTSNNLNFGFLYKF